jgi:hypothetical protein
MARLGTDTLPVAYIELQDRNVRKMQRDRLSGTDIRFWT